VTVNYRSSSDTADDRPVLGGTPESARARREVEGAARHQRALEESAGADSATRRTALLRDALTRKDQEILALKGQIAARERVAQEAREVAERHRRERAELEDRLRAAALVDQDRAQLARSLDAARRDAAQTAAALVAADGVVAEWRAALETVSRERDEARRQGAEMHRTAQELRTAWESLEQERRRAAEVHALEVAALRAQHTAALEQQRDAYERHLAEAAQRTDAVRDSHTLSMREAAEAHAQEVAAERAARLRAEESAASVLARRDEVERRNAEADRKLAECDRMHEGYARELDALRAAHARDLDQLDAARDAAMEAAREDAREDARAELLQEMEALRAVLEERDALSAELDVTRDRCAQLEALCTAAEESARDALAQAAHHEARARAEIAEVMARAEALRAREVSALRDDSETAVGELIEAHASALAEISEASAAALAELRERVAAETARADGLHDDLQRTREALGTYAADCAERLDAAERMAAEARGYRERMTRRLSEAVERLRVVTESAQRDADGMGLEIRRLTALVGRLTARVVVQSARTTAFARGAASPEGDDLDDAITRIADDLPDPVATALWDARDELLRRAVHSSAPC
jgi:chromosome segregation ATPase